MAMLYILQRQLQWEQDGRLSICMPWRAQQRACVRTQKDERAEAARVHALYVYGFWLNYFTSLGTHVKDYFTLLPSTPVVVLG